MCLRKNVNNVTFNNKGWDVAVGIYIYQQGYLLFIVQYYKTKNMIVEFACSCYVFIQGMNIFIGGGGMAALLWIFLMLSF